MSGAPVVESQGRAFPVETRYLGRDERQREPASRLLPGVPYYGAVYDDREDGRQHDDRTGLVDEEEYGRADQG